MIMEVIVSELLCFTLNKYGKSPDQNIKMVIIDFYDDEDILAAKKLLHSELMKVNVDGFPERLTQRKGDNRIKMSVDDIFTMIARADELQVLVKIPTFVAAKLEKIPWLKPDDLDLCLLAKRLSKLEYTIIQHTATLETIAMPVSKSVSDGCLLKENSGSHGFCEQLSVPNYQDGSVMNTIDNNTVNNGPSTQDLTSWAMLASDLNNDLNGGFNSVQSKKRTTRSVSRVLPLLVGTNQNESCRIKGAARRITAFVGRLHKDTAETELIEYLADAGIRDVKCKKLIPKNDKQYSTAAFFVSCPVAYKESFYNVDVWPEGCELRDWYFKSGASLNNNQ